MKTVDNDLASDSFWKIPLAGAHNRVQDYWQLYASEIYSPGAAQVPSPT
jgi:hypothetical protein